MRTPMQRATLQLPLTDIPLAQTIAQRMGWTLQPLSQEAPSSVVDPPAKPSQYSDRILRLRALRGSGISQADIDEDPRLAYLLGK